GLVGIVEKLLKGLTKELGGRPKIIATGGDVELFVRDMPSIKSVVPHLTLEGIMRAYRASTYSA
ncbi:MAG TPA: type III pantothenate kinase, partial [Candidatus Hypogeohydataceae bacterium YC38]